MGPSVKFVSPNKDLISKKKWGAIFFFFRKITLTGGGGVREGGEKTKLLFWQSILIRNQSRIPKTRFTLGLEWLWNIYSY